MKTQNIKAIRFSKPGSMQALRLSKGAAFCFTLMLLLSFGASAWAVFGDTDVTEEKSVLYEIVVNGNTQTDTSLILREMGLKIGQEFSYTDMDRVWDHLEDCGYFAYVDLEFDDSEPGQVSLMVHVEEDMTTSYGPLIKYDPRYKYLLGGWLEENNLRGKGEILEVSIAAFYNQKATLAWTRPWFLGVQGLKAKLDVSAEQGNFVYRPTRFRQWQAGFKVSWKSEQKFYVFAGINTGQDKYRDGYWWLEPDRGLITPAGSLWHGAETFSNYNFTTGLGFDNRDNPYYPTKGLLGEISMKRWQSDDFDSYTESVLDTRLFVSTPWEHILALRGWGRRTDGSAHLNNNLFFGGASTIRGYQLAQFEGDEGYLLSAEYRIPLFLMPISPKGELIGFGLHAFYDAGDTWYDAADAGKSWQSWGAGAHLNLDKQQLRFEAAKTKDGDWSFEFMDRFNF